MDESIEKINFTIIIIVPVSLLSIYMDMVLKCMGHLVLMNFSKFKLFFLQPDYCSVVECLFCLGIEATTLTKCLYGRKFDKIHFYHKHTFDILDTYASLYFCFRVL